MRSKTRQNSLHSHLIMCETLDRTQERIGRRREREERRRKRHRGSWCPRIHSSTRVKKGRRCCYVATVRWQGSRSMASILWDRRMEEELARFKNCARGGKETSPTLSRRLIADHWATWGPEDREKLLLTEAMTMKLGRRGKSGDKRGRQGQMGDDQQNCGTPESWYGHGSRSNGCVRAHRNP